MSFNDLAGSSSSAASPSAPTGGRASPVLPLYASDLNGSNPEFDRLAKRLGIQIFKITSNVTAIQKLVSLKGQDFTKRIHDLTETTRELVKDSTTDLRSLSAFTGLSGASKLTQSKLQRDFHAAALSFQRVQRSSLASTREALESERRTVAQLESSPQPSQQTQAQQQQQQQQQQQLEPQVLIEASDLEYHESLIASREAEIREIESGVQELNEIFRDLGNIVHEQGAMIDNIEFNINTVTENSQGAHRELVAAHEYQRKAGRRAACLLVIIGFVVTVVLLVILS